MGGQRLRELLESELDFGARSEHERTRATNRRVFREMVVGEIENRPLSWSRRRALVRFGESLGIDAFEARLIVRAVEYACGHVEPAAMADVEPAVETDYLARLAPCGASLQIAVVLLAGVLLGLVVLGLR
ncbi:MAG: hypothetical protein JXQ75_16670 [Phycisphaerae bacterium]|nr:hypothetical protein [Phycisphaerae bacterium]